MNSSDAGNRLQDERINKAITETFDYIVTQEVLKLEKNHTDEFYHYNFSDHKLILDANFPHSAN